jgi:hypothetical protein
MKSTQAWGWLAAGVLAAGLNAAYHDGGFEWAHRVADRVQHVSGAVVALASGRADRFLAEARELSAGNDGQVAALSDTVSAKADQEIARAEAAYARAEARQQAHCAGMRADRARIEARIAARAAFVHLPEVQLETAFRAIRIPAGPAISVRQIELSRVKFARCSRIRMRLPAIPNIGVPAAPPVNVSFTTESDE